MKYVREDAIALVESMKRYKSYVDGSMVGAIREACNVSGWQDKKYSEFL